MDIPHLLAHPDELNQETLYDLRRIVGVYPTYHAARILFLQNLFLLHDTTFDQELRRAALLVPDRRVLCNITQFGGLQPMLDRAQQHDATPDAPSAPETTATTEEPETAPPAAPAAAAPTTAPRRPRKKYVSEDTTLTLLDNFLGSTTAPLQRRPIKADPSTDYMAYLSQADETDNSGDPANPGTPENVTTTAHRMDELIDGFITSYQNGIKLSEDPEVPEDIIIDPSEAPYETPVEAPADVPAETRSEAPTADAGLSETLANIYIKQQKYDRALEVMTKMQTTAAKSNPYLADQVRFLQKLAINSRHKR